MKKIILSTALIGVFFSACGSLDDEVVKAYENGINSQLSFIKQQALQPATMLGLDVNVDINDFKCENQGDYALCKTGAINISYDNQSIAQATGVEIKSNSLYQGDKQGIISALEAYAAMPKDAYTNISIKGFKLGDIPKGMLSFLALQDPKIGVLLGLLKNSFTYDINTITNLKDALNVKISSILNHENNEISVETSIDADISKALFERLNKQSLLMFDINKQMFSSDITNQIIRMDTDVEENLIPNSMSLDVKIKNIDLVKDLINKAKSEPLLDAEKQQMRNDILDSIVKNKALKISVINKDKVSFLEKEKLNKSIIVKVNNIDISAVFVRTID